MSIYPHIHTETTARHWLVWDADEDSWTLDHEDCPLTEHPMSDPGHVFYVYGCHEDHLIGEIGLKELLGTELDSLDRTARHPVKAWVERSFVDTYHHYGWEYDEGLELLEEVSR